MYITYLDLFLFALNLGMPSAILPTSPLSYFSDCLSVFQAGYAILFLVAN